MTTSATKPRKAKPAPTPIVTIIGCAPAPLNHEEGEKARLLINQSADANTALLDASLHLTEARIELEEAEIKFRVAEAESSRLKAELTPLLQRMRAA